jgi:hypothetical protein
MEERRFSAALTVFDLNAALKGPLFHDVREVIALPKSFMPRP